MMHPNDENPSLSQCNGSTAYHFSLYVVACASTLSQHTLVTYPNAIDIVPPFDLMIGAGVHS